MRLTGEQGSVPNEPVVVDVPIQPGGVTEPEASSCESASGPGECQPFVRLPAWWSGFMFHTLNPRQVSIYTYLTMLCDDNGSCRPTVDQIREDLGLYSSTMVFDALSALEDLGFIVRERQAFGDSRSRRNVYRRTACEFTIQRLIERGKIDGMLRPIGQANAPASEESKILAREGIRSLLDDRFERYDRATPDAKRDVLLEELTNLLAERPNGIFQ